MQFSAQNPPKNRFLSWAVLVETVAVVRDTNSAPEWNVLEGVTNQAEWAMLRRPETRKANDRIGEQRDKQVMWKLVASIMR